MGNVRFIGELCKQDIVPIKVIFECMRLLLCAEVGSEESSTIKDKQDEYDVEMVCKMIQTLGPVLDKMKGKNLQAFGQVWELYLDTLSTISKDKSYSSRTRFTVEETKEGRISEERRKEEVIRNRADTQKCRRRRGEKKEGNGNG